MTLTKGKIAAALMVSVITLATAAHHIQATGSAELRGYRWGNEDGYSLGYNDGRTGAEPNPHRFMTPADHELRTSAGGRDPGR